MFITLIGSYSAEHVRGKEEQWNITQEFSVFGIVKIRKNTEGDSLDRGKSTFSFMSFY